MPHLPLSGREDLHDLAEVLDLASTHAARRVAVREGLGQREQTDLLVRRRAPDARGPVDHGHEARAAAPHGHDGLNDRTLGHPAVDGRRRSSTLQVARDHTTNRRAGREATADVALELGGELVDRDDAVQPDRLGDHDDDPPLLALIAEQPRDRVLALAQDLGAVAVALGVDRQISLTREGGLHRQPAALAPHRLEELHAVMRLGRVRERVHHAHQGVGGAVLTDRAGGRHVPIDRERRTAHDHALELRECQRRPHGPVAAEDQQASDVRIDQVSDGDLLLRSLLEARDPSCSEDGAAPAGDAIGITKAKPDEIRLEEPLDPVQDPDRLEAAVQAGLDRCSNRSVHARGVAATGEHGNPCSIRECMV